MSYYPFGEDDRERIRRIVVEVYDTLPNITVGVAIAPIRSTPLPQQVYMDPFVCGNAEDIVLQKLAVLQQDDFVLSLRFLGKTDFFSGGIDSSFRYQNIPAFARLLVAVHGEERDQNDFYALVIASKLGCLSFQEARDRICMIPELEGVWANYLAKGGTKKSKTAC